MQLPSKDDLVVLREKYPAGTRIRLVQMGQDPYPIPPGTIGEVTHIDDCGSIFMRWENGRSLALIPSEDTFEVISGPEEMHIKAKRLP